jgi:hypothetical protein
MTTKLVRDTAKELAGAFFDNQDVFRDGRMNRSQLFRIKAGSQREFVRTYWKDFVPLARSILGRMLSEPGRSDTDKDRIYDALLNERGAMNDEQLAAPSILRLN